MKKILRAILSGKPRSEIMGMLTDEDKAILSGLAKDIGFTRQQRRKMMRDARK